MQNEKPNPLEPFEDGEEGWDRSIEPSPGPEKRPPAKPAAHVLRRAWNPQPLAKPRIDPQLPRMEWPERVAEVIRYTAARLEYWISRTGLLREWVKVNIWLAIALSVVAVLVVPAMSAILAGAEAWTALVAKIVGNTMNAVLKLPPIVLSVAAIVVVWHFLKTRWLTRRRNRPSHKQDGFDQYQ